MELDAGRAGGQNAPAVGQLYGLPNNLGYQFYDRERERTNAQLTVQFAPTDSLMLTADYTFAENHLVEHRGDRRLWMHAPASAVTFDTDQVVATPTMISENVPRVRTRATARSSRPDQYAQFRRLQRRVGRSNDTFTLGFDIP